MDNAIDSIQLEIEVSASKAVENINGLTSSLKKLDRLGKSGGLVKLKQNLQELAQVRLDKLEAQLSNIEKHVERLSKVQKALRAFDASVPGADTRKTRGSFDKLVKEVESAQQEVRHVLDGFSEFKEPPNAEEWNRFGNEISSTTKRFDDLKKKIDESKAAVGGLGKKADESSKGIKRLFDKFKNVAFYRLVRRMLQQISQAAKEGLQNIAQFSEQANSVLSQYKTQGLYLKNSFGSALLPILQVLLPMAIQLSDALSDILNSIGMITAALNGSKTFIRAKKYAQDYANALKNVKTATIGLDELNIIDSTSSGMNYADMFEEVDITSAGLGDAIAKIAELTGVVAGLFLLVKGQKIGEFFSSIGKSIDTIHDKLRNMEPWQKAITSVAMLGAEAGITYNAIYGVLTGTKGVGAALLELIPTIAVVSVALYDMWGPVGLTVEAVVLAVSAVAAKMNAVSDAAHDKAMEEFWNTSGVAIEEVNSLLEMYFRSINLDKQDEWNRKLDEASVKLADAAKNYDFLWRSVQGCESIDQSTIHKLSDAFNELADAAKNLNSAAINSLMEGIRTGISLNITPEITAKLDGLVSSLQTANDLINMQITGLTSEYQVLLNEIAQNGGKISDAQRDKLNALRTEINELTLTDKTSSYEWALSLEEAKEKGISAGTDREALESAVNDLNVKRDSYNEIIKKNQASSLSTLSQLIEIDRDKFGGSLGFYEKGKSLEENSNYKALMDSYAAQIDEVNRQFNEVIDSIIDNYSKNALNYADYEHYSGILEFVHTASAAVAGLLGWAGVRNKNGETGWEYLGNKKAAEEQQEILDWLKKQKGYATGGQPESGEIFKAREDGIPELVGTIGHRTTVANNTQIIEGIKEGVYEAMQQAQGGDDSSEKTIYLTVNLDGKQIAEVVEKYNKRRTVGRTIYAGGVLNGV